MKVCLIRPPRVLKLMALSQKPAAPFGLAYLAGTLHKAGHEIKVIDGAGEAPDQYHKFIDDFLINGISADAILERIPADVELIGYSCMFTGNWLFDRILIDKIGAAFPNAMLIAGGEHVTAVPEFCLGEAEHLDVCVRGEGEETILDIIEVVKGNKSFAEVEGIVYRHTNEFIRTGKRARIRKLDEIAEPAWDYFPIDNYQLVNSANGVFRTRTLPILASRGCPYECTFCSSPQMWGTKYSLRTPVLVVDEMEKYMKLYGVQNFDFFDLTAIVKKDWIIEFASIIIDRKLNISWQIPGGTRAEVIDEEVAAYLYNSGCTNITYAPESGSQHILDLIKKRVRLPAMIKSIKASRKNNLSIKLNMIIGFPDETHLDIWKTIWFLIKCAWIGVDDMFPANFTPYPGSELFSRLIREDRISLNDDYFKMIVISYTYSHPKRFSDHVGINALRFYTIFQLLIFYSCSFLFRPGKVFRMVRNLVTRKYETRSEILIAELFKKKEKIIVVDTVQV